MVGKCCWGASIKSVWTLSNKKKIHPLFSIRLRRLLDHYENVPLNFKSGKQCCESKQIKKIMLLVQIPGAFMQLFSEQNFLLQL